MGQEQHHRTRLSRHSRCYGEVSVPGAFLLETQEVPPHLGALWGDGLAVGWDSGAGGRGPSQCPPTEWGWCEIL